MKTTNNKIMSIMVILFMTILTLPVTGQVLDLESTTEGALLPRMTTEQRLAISSPSEAELVYDTDSQTFWYWEDMIWKELNPSFSEVDLIDTLKTSDKQIIDFQETRDTIALSQQGTYNENTKIIVCLNINHTYMGDNVIKLIAPDGVTFVELSIQNGQDGDNFTNTCFANNAGTSITTINASDAPFTGYYLPEGDFSDFIGQQLTGDWILSVEDVAIGDAGMLIDWNLKFLENPSQIISSITDLDCDTSIEAGDGEDNDVINLSVAGDVKMNLSNNAVNIKEDLTLDRTQNSAEVRQINIKGARNAFGSSFANINFENFDNNSGSFEYVGARISSLNHTSDNGGDLRFITRNPNGTLVTRMIITQNIDFFDKFEFINGYANGKSRIEFKNNNENVIIGLNNMANNSSGFENIAIGSGSLLSNTGGNENIALGSAAMFANETGERNISIGKNALRENTTGNYNIAIGYNALSTAVARLDNIAIGKSTLSSLNNGSGNNNNTVIGSSALDNITSGGSNVSLGFNSMGNKMTGSQNVGIGNSTLLNNSGGTGNVAIGHQAGGNEGGSNKLYIENSSAGPEDALIFGDFAQNFVQVNNRLNVNEKDPNNFYVAFFKQTANAGVAYSRPGTNDRWSQYIPTTNNMSWYYNSTFLGQFNNSTGAYSSISDRSLKENITELSGALDKIKQLGKAKRYNFISDTNKTPQIGFIAQEVNALFPEFVEEPGDEQAPFYSLDYAGLSTVAISAIVEQQDIIEQQEERIKILEEALNENAKKMSEIEELLLNKK